MAESVPLGTSIQRVATEYSPLLGRSEDRPPLYSRRATVTLAISTGLMVVIGGIYICISYLAKPVQAACPSWSSSATVWGIAVMLVGDGLTGTLVGPFVVRQNVGGLVAVGTLCGALAFGIGGAAVLTCERSPMLTQMAYVVHFGVMGLMVCIQYLSAIETLFHRFPNRKGAVGGFIATIAGIGSMVLGQLLSWFQGLTSSGSLPAGAILFILGLLSITLSLPFCVCVWVLYSRGTNDPDYKNNSDSRAEKRICPSRSWGEVVKTPQFVILFCAYFGTLFTGWGIIAHLDSFLDWLWMGAVQPTAVLTLIATACYTGGRALWALTSDSVGVQNTWRLCSVGQALLVSVLPWVAITDKTWSRYAAVSLLCIDLVFFSGPKVTTGALASIIFPGRLTRTAIGLMVLAFDLSGALGPLVCEAMFRRYESYTQFLVGFGLLPLVSLILLFFLRPVKTEDYPVGWTDVSPHTAVVGL